MNFILKILIIYFILITNSFAYIDPGTGSIILQAILGFLAAFFAGASFYWNKIKDFLKKKFVKSNDKKDQEDKFNH